MLTYPFILLSKPISPGLHRCGCGCADAKVQKMHHFELKEMSYIFKPSKVRILQR
jgi:hypothetical protein